MTKLHILQDFKFAFGGTRVVSFAAGDEVMVSDAECIDVATAEGWAEIVVDEEPVVPTTPSENAPTVDQIAAEVKAQKPAQNKARNGAPQNK